MCSRQTPGRNYATKLSRCPFTSLRAMVGNSPFLTWAIRPATRCATGAQMASKLVAGKAEAGRPTRSVAHLARVIHGQSRSPLTALRGLDSVTMPWQSKSGRFERVRRSRCTHPAGRPGTVRARRNLRLNLLDDSATVRARSMRFADHLPAVHLICTVQLTSTHALKLTPCGLPTSSLAGGGGVQLPGGSGQLNNPFERI